MKKSTSMFFLPSNLWIMANDGNLNKATPLEFLTTLVTMNAMNRNNMNYVKLTYFFKELTWESLHTTKLHSDEQATSAG